MLVNALKSQKEYVGNRFTFPKIIEWENFKTIFLVEDFGRWAMNSAIITIISVLLSIVLAIFTAYALSRFKFKFRITITNFIISLIIVPPIVMIIPLFLLMAKINFLNTYHGIIVIYTGLILPFSIYLLLGFFKTIPRSLIESAYLDGATSFRIILNIIVPLSLPAIGTLVVVNANWVWNDLLIALIFMQKENMRTIIGGLSQFFSYKYQMNVPLVMMGLTIASIPIVIIYIFTQRYFVRGFTAGAMKE